MANERLKTYDELFNDNFNSFIDWVPSTEERYTRALQLADPEYRNEDGLSVPIIHQGYNFLLGNWNSNETHLNHVYRQLYELMINVAKIPRGETVIAGEPIPLSEGVEAIQEEPRFDAMESGQIELCIGRLRSDELDYQYKSRLDKKRRGVGSLKPPFLLSTARVQLGHTHTHCFDIGSSWRKEGSYRDVDTPNIITLGATLEGDDETYRKQNFAHITPVILGNDACADFLQKLEENYMINPDSQISEDYRHYN